MNGPANTLDEGRRTEDTDGEKGRAEVIECEGDIANEEEETDERRREGELGGEEY